MAVALIVAAVTAAYKVLLPVNPTTVALTFLVAVLVVSASWGLQYSIFLAVLATLAFNFYFLPPFGTLTIADPHNWIALLAFLITAIVASQLSERARRAAFSADSRRRDVERLYSFSQHLLETDNVVSLLNVLPEHIVSAFGVSAAAVYLVGRDDVYRSGPDTRRLDRETLAIVAARGEPRFDTTEQRCFMPLRLGVRPVGAIGVTGIMSGETLEAVGSLVAIAIERARAVEQVGKTEASREGERLRSALLDSVTHEFRTPLTSIKASVTGLLSDSQLDPAQRRDLLTVIDEEADHLNRLVGEAAEMAQLDAGQVQLQLEPHQIREAIDDALEESRQAVGGHPVEINLPPVLPPVLMDVDRIREVIAQLLENAGKYSAEGTPIRITSEVAGQRLTTSVADHGPGIDDFEQALIFDKFYRGRNQRTRVAGTGMGLAIARAIVEAHGGSIGVTSQLGHGSVFYFSLPCNSQPVAPKR